MRKEADNGILIHSYSPAGFNVDGNRVFGPCALLPPAILQWNVRPKPTANPDSACRREIIVGSSFCRLAVTKTSQKTVFPSSTCSSLQ